MFPFSELNLLKQMQLSWLLKHIQVRFFYLFIFQTSHLKDMVKIAFLQTTLHNHIFPLFSSSYGVVLVFLIFQTKLREMMLKLAVP